MRKELGKIVSVRFGFGGYDDAMIGFSFVLGNDSWSVNSFWGTWARWDASCKWVPFDQIISWGHTCERMRDLLSAARKTKLDELVGVPVEVTFDDNNALSSWRVLTEVV